MAASFVISIFLAAALMFAVEPMVGRLVLPSMGGSPSVWNTVVVCFQLALLAGYALAHLIAKARSLRVQALLHAMVLVPALLALPVGVEAEPLAGQRFPALALLGRIALDIGPLALALSTVSPLLQRWYASLDLRRSDDPYFLYAASNAGSLVGLLGYPLLVEPAMGLSAQRSAWSIAFGVLVLALVTAWVTISRRTQTPPLSDEESGPERAAGGPMRWVVLALVPSSLLLGVTQHITTDIAAVPLLWAIPLALYLVTFIIAFGTPTERLLRALTRAVPVLVVALAVAVMVDARHPLVVVVALHLAAFFAVALACHARLAEARPPAQDLTRYYLFLSIGGVLGGVVNALLAPLVLSWVAEYPIMIALGAGLAVGWPRLSARTLVDALPALALVVVLIGAMLTAPADSPWSSPALIGVPAVVCFLCSSRPVRFALTLLVAMLVPGLIRPGEHIVQRERTFFGVHTVLHEDGPRGPRHALRHGGTLHGLQNLGSNESQTYYHTTGPMGEVFGALPAGADIAAIGLGVGSVAALARPGDTLAFHEIDPEVVRIASDPELFTYVRDSNAEIGFILGDGRLTIAGAEPMDLIIVDAFTSDAIPVHLLTAEALRLYAGRLKPGGLVALHLSNRYLDLAPVVAATAHEAGLIGRIRTDVPSATQINDGKEMSTWAVLAVDPEALAPCMHWDPLEAWANVRPWTDDFANILGVLRLD